MFPYELIHGFGLDSGFDSRTVKPTGNEVSFLTGSTRKTARSSSLEDDFSGGFRGNHAFPADNNYKAWGATLSSLCGAGDGYGRRNQNCQTRVSSQAAACDLYCSAVEEKLATMNISDGYNNSGRGIVDLPRKHPLAPAAAAAVRNPNDDSGYYSRQSLQYHKLQALQFQQQQLLLMRKRRGLKANNSNKIVTQSPSVWSNQQPQRSDGSGMRAVFLGGGDRTGKRRSTGTGVFLPRRVNHTSPETREKPSVATVLIPARVAKVLNLDESVVQPSVRSSASSRLNEPSWRQKSYNGGFSSQMKMEQTAIEPRLPSDWAY